MKKLVSILLATMLVLSCLAGMTFAADAEASWTDGTTTVEGTVKELTSQVSKSGGTLKLLKDVDMVHDNYAISSNQSFTFDLNGHKFTANNYGIQVSNKATGTTVITDSVGGGSMVCGKFVAAIKGGGIQIKNATLYSTAAQTVAYYTADAAYAATNLIENATIVTDSWCCLAFNNTGADQVNSSVTIKNSTLVNAKSGNVIDLQAKPEGSTATVILGAGNKFYAAKSMAPAKVKLLGETATKGASGQSVTAAGKTVSGMTVWTTPATATVDLGNVSATTPAAPSTPTAPSAPSATSNAEAWWTDGKTSVEGTLAEMGKQASSKGGTIKLLKDVSLDSTSYAITSNQSFTFDLNGHNFTTAGMGISITNKATGVTVITDSVGGGLYRAAKNCATVRGGGLQIKNVTLWSEGTQTLNYYDVTGKWNNDNIIENATVVSDTWYCLSFNNDSSQEKASFTVKNSTLVSNHAKGHNLLGLQGKAVAANVVLGEGVKLYTKTSAPINKGLNQFGETLTKSGSAKSVTVAGKTIADLNEWTTPAKGTVDLTTVIPGGVTPGSALASTPGTPAETPTTSAPSFSASGVQFPATTPAAKAKATWTLGGATVEGTLAQLTAEAAKRGGTVTLKENAEFTGSSQYPITADASFTLDLGGNTIVTEKSLLSVTNKAKGITVIKNGTVLSKGACVVTVRGGALQILDATLWTPVAQAINYYPDVDTYNQANLIENSTVISEKWYALSFNNTDANQELACFGIKNSTLINTQKTQTLGLQLKPEGSTAQIALGENVKLYNAGTSASNKAINLLGASLTAGAKGTSVSAAGATFTGLNEWKTSAEVVDLSTVIPGDAFTAPAETGTATAPAAPSTPAASEITLDAQHDGRQLKADAPAATLTALGSESASGNVGIIIAIVAVVAVAAVAVIAVVVLKKKKK